MKFPTKKILKTFLQTHPILQKLLGNKKYANRIQTVDDISKKSDCGKI